MQRREFISYRQCGCSRRARSSVIGSINAGSAVQWAHLVAAFRKGLQEVGYTDGQNVDIEYRWAEGNYDRLPTMVADLVRRRVNVIRLGWYFYRPGRKETTATIPIVFTNGGDPVKSGLVNSLNRPGGNITGVGSFILVTGSKRPGVLHELVHPIRVAAVTNPGNPSSDIETKDLQSAAKICSQQLPVLDTHSELLRTAWSGPQIKRGTNCSRSAPAGG
jgi:putative tryptophan/tyrosine transport system substrate-binding protein